MARGKRSAVKPKARSLMGKARSEAKTRRAGRGGSKGGSKDSFSRDRSQNDRGPDYGFY